CTVVLCSCYFSFLFFFFSLPSCALRYLHSFLHDALPILFALMLPLAIDLSQLEFDLIYQISYICSFLNPTYFIRFSLYFILLEGALTTYPPKKLEKSSDSPIQTNLSYV